MLQNSPFGERLNMLYLIEITKLNGKAFFGAAVFGTAETLPVSAKGLERTGQEPTGRGVLY